MTYSFPPIPERIQWHEGLLLAPQHFQQTQARTDALVSWHGLAATPLAWGVRHMEIDPGLLANGLAASGAVDSAARFATDSSSRSGWGGTKVTPLTYQGPLTRGHGDVGTASVNL